MEKDGKIMTKVLGLSVETNSYLIDYDSGDKKSKRHKKVHHKKNLI